MTFLLLQGNDSDSEIINNEYIEEEDIYQVYKLEMAHGYVKKGEKPK